MTFIDRLAYFDYQSGRIKFMDDAHTTYAFADNVLVVLPHEPYGTLADLQEWVHLMPGSTVEVTWGPEVYPRLIHKIEIVDSPTL